MGMKGVGIGGVNVVPAIGAVIDKIVSTFRSLRGMSMESISEEG